MPRHLTLLLIAFVPLAGCATHSANRPTDQASGPATSQPVRPAAQDAPPFVFTAGEVPVADLIARCGEYLKWNILVSPQELQYVHPPAVVALDRDIKTDRDGCADLLSSLLWSKGFGLTPLDESKGVYEVICLSGARARAFTSRTAHRTAEQVRARPNSYFCVTVVAPLQHTNATIATNALRPFFASTGGALGASLTLGNVGNNSAMVICGPQNSVVAALDMLRTVDVPAEGAAAPGLGARLDKLTQTVEQLGKRVDALEKKN